MRWETDGCSEYLEQIPHFRPLAGLHPVFGDGEHRPVVETCEEDRPDRGEIPACAQGKVSAP